MDGNQETSGSQPIIINTLVNLERQAYELFRNHLTFRSWDTVSGFFPDDTFNEVDTTARTVNGRAQTTSRHTTYRYHYPNRQLLLATLLDNMLDVEESGTKQYDEIEKLRDKALEVPFVERRNLLEFDRQSKGYTKRSIIRLYWQYHFPATVQITLLLVIIGILLSVFSATVSPQLCNSDHDIRVLVMPFAIASELSDNDIYDSIHLSLVEELQVEFDKDSNLNACMVRGNLADGEYSQQETFDSTSDSSILDSVTAKAELVFEDLYTDERQIINILAYVAVKPAEICNPRDGLPRSGNNDCIDWEVRFVADEDDLAANIVTKLNESEFLLSTNSNRSNLAGQSRTIVTFLKKDILVPLQLFQAQLYRYSYLNDDDNFKNAMEAVDSLVDTNYPNYNTKRAIQYLAGVVTMNQASRELRDQDSDVRNVSLETEISEKRLDRVATLLSLADEYLTQACGGDCYTIAANNEVETIVRLIVDAQQSLSSVWYLKYRHQLYIDDNEGTKFHENIDLPLSILQLCSSLFLNKLVAGNSDYVPDSAWITRLQVTTLLLSQIGLYDATDDLLLVAQCNTEEQILELYSESLNYLYSSFDELPLGLKTEAEFWRGKFMCDVVCGNSFSNIMYECNHDDGVESYQNAISFSNDPERKNQITDQLNRCLESE